MYILPKMLSEFSLNVKLMSGVVEYLYETNFFRTTLIFFIVFFYDY